MTKRDSKIQMFQKDVFTTEPLILFAFVIGLYCILIITLHLSASSAAAVRKFSLTFPCFLTSNWKAHDGIVFVTSGKNIESEYVSLTSLSEK